MRHNKQIVALCPNFYKIINFDYYENDVIFDKLLTVYQSYIFSIDISKNEDVTTAQELDKIVSTYIDDYLFRKELKTCITSTKIVHNGQNIVRSIVDFLIKAFEKYEYQTTRNIYITRWI